MDEITRRYIHGFIEDTAKRYDVAEETLIEEIEDIIMDGYLRALFNHDLQAYNKWKAIPSEKEIPDAYEFLYYLLGEIRKMEKWSKGKFFQEK